MSSNYTNLSFSNQNNSYYMSIEKNKKQLYHTQQKDYPLTHWWNWYSKGLFILALFYNPEEEKNEESMFCFIDSLFKMFPNSTIRSLASDFINMKQYVVELLEQNCTSFWRTYPSYLNAIKLSVNMPQHFLRLCLQSSDTMFIYLYLFQCFVLIMHNKQGHNVTIPHYMDIKALYDKKKIDKFDWGRPIWFVLHTVALYAPDPLTESFTNYKQILTCLQNLLPCPQCRFHLSENLHKINIDMCGKSRMDLFKCSFDLHNIVNESTNKPILSLQQALQIYTYTK
jgi:hypothetical protein